MRNCGGRQAAHLRNSRGPAGALRSAQGGGRGGRDARKAAARDNHPRRLGVTPGSGEASRARARERGMHAPSSSRLLPAGATHVTTKDAHMPGYAGLPLPRLRRVAPSRARDPPRAWNRGRSGRRARGAQKPPPFSADPGPAPAAPRASTVRTAAPPPPPLPLRGGRRTLGPFAAAVAFTLPVKWPACPPEGAPRRRCSSEAFVLLLGLLLLSSAPSQDGIGRGGAGVPRNARPTRCWGCARLSLGEAPRCPVMALLGAATAATRHSSSSSASSSFFPRRLTTSSTMAR